MRIVLKVKHLAILLLLVLPAASQAGPINWLKHHKRALAEGAALAGATLLEAKASGYCRAGDQERCFGGYGGPNASLAINSSVGLGLFAAAQRCHAEQGNWWLCYGLGLGVPTFQTYVGIHDFVSYRPEATPDKFTVRNFK